MQARGLHWLQSCRRAVRAGASLSALFLAGNALAAPVGSLVSDDPAAIAPNEKSDRAALTHPQTRERGDIAASPRQQLDDAWWTGPMLAASAETLPSGHVLIEPYMFDIRTKGSDHFANLTYLLYGLTDRFSVGLIALNGVVVPRRRRASALALGDTTLLAQYRLIRFGEHGFPATVSMVVQEGLPTGPFDQLESRSVAGLGSGARTTQFAVYVQSYVWLPNGRILRLRLDAAHTLQSSAKPRGQSIYGTPSGFRGEAKRGASEVIDTSFEYSFSKRFVLSWEMVWQHSGKTRVSGLVSGQPGAGPFSANLPSSDPIYFAPAVEYSWRPNIGVLFGVRLSPKGRNAGSSITPALALNWVL